MFACFAFESSVVNLIYSKQLLLLSLYNFVWPLNCFNPNFGQVDCSFSSNLIPCFHPIFAKNLAPCSFVNVTLRQPLGEIAWRRLWQRWGEVRYNKASFLKQQVEEMRSQWNAKLMKCQINIMPSWWNAKLMKFQVNEIPSSWNAKSIMQICWNSRSMKCQVDETQSWWNAKLMKCKVDEMPSWWNAKLMKCQVDEMHSWWNAKLMKSQIDEKPS